MSPESSQPLTDTIARLQRLLVVDGALPQALIGLTEVARELIPLAAGAGITVVDDQGECTTIAATDPAVTTADTTQYELGAGPCLRAWDTAAVQYVPDTTTDARWPAWSQVAARAGIRSVLSAPLFSPAREIGAMKVYAREPHAFTDYDEHLLGLLAQAAAPLVAAATSSEDLDRLVSTFVEALDALGRVEQAVGVLMERHHLPAPGARAHLLATARAAGRSLAQAAEDLLHATGVPPRTPPPPNPPAPAVPPHPPEPLTSP